MWQNIQPIQKQEKLNNTGLPDNLKSGIENLSGYSMDDVKVHYNSPKPSQLQAHAYAQGTDIHVASGQEQHLPHEAWHVVQQKQGRVKPTMQLQGINVNDDIGFEQEADIMGRKALQVKSQTSASNLELSSLLSGKQISSSNQTVQGLFYEQNENGKFIWHWGPVINKYWTKALDKSGNQVLHKGYGVWDRIDGESHIDFQNYLQKISSTIIKKAPTILIGVFIVQALASMPVVAAETVIQETLSANSTTLTTANYSSVGSIIGDGILLTTNFMSLAAPFYVGMLQNQNNQLAAIELYNQSDHYYRNNNPFSNYSDQVCSIEESLDNPMPTKLKAKNAKLGQIKDHGGGASGAKRTKSVDFENGKKWELTFLKDSQANANVGSSTVHSSMYGAKHLQSLGVTVPEIELIKHENKKMIASKALDGGFEAFKDNPAQILSDQNKVDYAKLALFSPIADLHKGNVGISNGNLGTIDVDTSLPYLTHWHSRAIDRFDLPEERYATTDIGSNYLGQGLAQDHFYKEKVNLQAKHMIQAIEDFCDISIKKHAENIAYFPLQGAASQKLALHSIKIQQEMYRTFLENYENDKQDNNEPWEKSNAYQKLSKTITEFENDNKFPYKFTVKKGQSLKIEINPDFERPDGTEVWKDKTDDTTNPELLEVVQKGFFGDANLRLSDKTAIDSSDIATMIQQAKKFTRSIGDGNPVIELVAKLINHPSFDKMSAKDKKLVLDQFNPAPKNGNPLRQAFYPRNKTKGEPFKSDNFYKGGKQEVINAYEKLKAIA